MKKIITTATGGLMFLAASILPASCISIPDDLDNKEIEESISLIQARTIEGIQDALDQPIVVVSQTGDTVVAYSPDSIAEGSPVRKITVHVDEHKDMRPFTIDHQRQLITAISAITIPCVTVLLIALAILIFIFVRNRNRNAIISQAIDKGYELPESFYSGQSTTRIIYQNAPAQSKAYSENSDNNTHSTESSLNTSAQINNMPPIPPTPPVSNRNLHSGIQLAVIGLCILIFFIVIDTASVGIIAGGIPLLLGLGRIASWYYIDQRH